MELTKTTYIALGSNKGDKLQYLQLAINAIHETVGAVLKISKIYNTPPLGFKGDNFFNACVKVTTHLEADSLLSNLKNIESRLGRVYKEANQYESRTIDLDIILYEDVIINNNYLQIPHPKMHERLFVMYPLFDIAKNAVHPIFQKTIRDLLIACKDTSEVSIVNSHLKNH